MITLYVFPTPVGMSHRSSSAQRRRSGVPHTRGDEPPAAYLVSVSNACSPHPWG